MEKTTEFPPPAKTEAKKRPIAIIGLLILGKLAKLAKTAKLLKVAKPMLMLISMSLSVIAYAFMLGPWLAVLFVALLFVHEMGHVVAMKQKGFDTPTPVFIPFLGAVVFAPKFENRDTEAYVGFGGPFLGLIATAITFAIWWMMPPDSDAAHIMLVGSYLSCYLNLFNLIPLSPLDGGRITQAVGTWCRYIGLLGLAVFSIFLAEPVILFIWLMVISELTVVPIKIRAALSSICWVSMVVLMAMGYSSQPWYIDWFDIIFGLAFVSICFFQIKLAIEDTKDNRPGLELKNRIKWLVYYLVLSAALIAILFLQFPELAKIKTD